MAITPRELVPAPPITPSRFGLSSAADQIITDPSMRLQRGIEWETNPCGPPTLDVSTCAEGMERTLPDGIGTEVADPITVFAGFTCRAVGLPTPLPEFLDVRAALALSTEWVGVEQALWGSTLLRLMRGQLPPEDPEDPAPEPEPDDTLVLSETPVSLVRGIGMLEAHLGANYGGVGVLHAPRLLAPHAAAVRQVEVESGRKTTVLGTRWAFGAGYPNTQPNGLAASAGTAWIVATGAVTYRRTPITHRRTDSPREYFDPATNEIRAIASRTYVVAFDTCVRAAIPVTLL